MKGQNWIYSQGCLNPQKHAGLVAEIDKFAAIAGLGGANKRFIWEPIEKYELTETEKQVLKNLTSLAAKGKGGLLYTGKDAFVIAERLMALTGCMLRNFIDARFMTLESIIDEYKASKFLGAAVACIPNLYTDGKQLPSWQSSFLYDLLVQHFSDGKLIFGFVGTPGRLRSAYPAAVYDHLKNHFFTIGEPL